MKKFSFRLNLKKTMLCFKSKTKNYCNKKMKFKDATLQKWKDK